MESTAVLPLSQFPYFSPLKSGNKKTYPSWPCRPRSSQSTRLHCQKMYVPGFGEASPEAKAAKNLHNFFTYIAVSIVTAQLQSYNPEAYEELMEFLNSHSLNDGDKFCASLMRESSRHKSLGIPMSSSMATARQLFASWRFDLLIAKMILNGTT
ncbi:chaperonin-like RBCX protein 1, chloroplastic isoform X2 [Juglans microcarpa x Juglans regia]|uniref:chaperonin-like RBCX protein 1, chloroplastic isoform X2 n=1 Tax=Juglans microcarpa x Juglans regia TaxID=2249226 RepID=UPI001B7E759C|nr:chaperonin-like RBCX protein 1, chloroplastic isoform X2 [Juglans microcarpa x Juglans regia]